MTSRYLTCSWLALLLAACNVYNPGLLDRPDASSGDGGPVASDDGGGAGVSGGGAGGSDAGAAGSGDADAGEVDTGPGDLCVPNPDDDGSCPLICPEVCDGADNDCDGETDGAAAALACDLPHATAQCIKGDCVIEHCTGVYGDCNGVSDDGCESPLDTLEDCGICQNACDGTSCAGGVCSQLQCDAGYADCDGDPDTGCEASLSTLLNCIMCGRVCAFDNAGSSCESGECAFVECVAGWGDCDEDRSNGCELQLDTLDDCGECGNACEKTACAGGVCSALDCGDGFADCDGDEDNACETELLSSMSDCGMCGRSCELENTISVCDDGQCEIIQCQTGFDDCDGDLLNGCEAALDSLDNCGRCGIRCEIPDGEASCAGGICTAAQCNPGYADCDGRTGNGCEVSLHSLADCGMCGAICDPPHASESCDTGTCEIVDCDGGWGDCNPDPGCETQLGTLANCSACGDACTDLPNIVSAGCSSLTCTISECAGGWGDCNDDPGCETPLGTPQNCLQCGDVCPDLPNASEVCDLGVCGLGDCEPDWGNCNADPGCETPLDTVTDCGGCQEQGLPHDCALLPNAMNFSCPDGSCAYDCDEGYLDCDPDPAYGCETTADTSSDCGGCGNLDSQYDCHALPGVDQVACSEGACIVNSCDPGREDCNDTDSDGCETELGTVQDCSDCDDTCSAPPQATAGCNGSLGSYQCGIGQCNGGWGDCNDAASDGCESSLATATDCGGCGNLDPQYDCTALPDVDETACPAGACVVNSCDAGFQNCDRDHGNGCEVQGPVCYTIFLYTPSNFDPAPAPMNLASSGTVTLNCGVSTFDSQNLTFGNWCGQIEPTPVVRTQPGGPDLVILPLLGLTVAAGSTLDLLGNRPVILAVYGDAVIDGQVDASASGATPGPGGNASDCGNGGNGLHDATGDDGSNGGGGGGFGSAGANGANGHQCTDCGGGSAGAVSGAATLVPLRGGCRGGDGGSSAGDAHGGGGGGAVQISTAGALKVTGTVSAAGGGGRRGSNHEDGGGGGGSGGAVLLEGDSVSISSSARLTANGGGGASGNDTNGANGDHGDDGSQTGTSRAPGGTGDYGGDGGDGGASAGAPTSGSEGQNECTNWIIVCLEYTPGAGGGGGGGGVGRVRINRATTCTPPGTQSPAPTVSCHSCGTDYSSPENGCAKLCYETHTYYYCGTTRDQANASTRCTGAGMYPVRVDGSAENRFLRASIGADSWIGANDLATEGTWIWSVDGQAFWQGASDGGPVAGRYSNWNAGEPNDASGEDCAQLLTSGFWNDLSCAGSLAYICEGE